MYVAILVLDKAQAIVSQGVVAGIVVVVGAVDGTDGAVARGDVAGLVGWGLSSVCTGVSQVLQSSIDVPASFSRRGGSSSCTVCVAALTVVARVVWVLELMVVAGSVWEAVSSVLGVAWVLALLQVVFSGFVRGLVIPGSAAL